MRMLHCMQAARECLETHARARTHAQHTHTRTHARRHGAVAAVLYRADAVGQAGGVDARALAAGARRRVPLERAGARVCVCVRVCMCVCVRWRAASWPAGTGKRVCAVVRACVQPCAARSCRRRLSLAAAAQLELQWLMNAEYFTRMRGTAAHARSCVHAAGRTHTCARPVAAQAAPPQHTHTRTAHTHAHTRRSTSPPTRCTSSAARRSTRP